MKARTEAAGHSSYDDVPYVAWTERIAHSNFRGIVSASSANGIEEKRQKKREKRPKHREMHSIHSERVESASSKNRRVDDDSSERREGRQCRHRCEEYRRLFLYEMLDRTSVAVLRLRKRFGESERHSQHHSHSKEYHDESRDEMVFELGGRHGGIEIRECEETRR